MKILLECNGKAINPAFSNGWQFFENVDSIGYDSHDEHKNLHFIWLEHNRKRFEQIDSRGINIFTIWNIPKDVAILMEKSLIKEFNGHKKSTGAHEGYFNKIWFTRKTPDEPLK